MEPKLAKRSEMTLVGLVGCSSDVSELDIFGLWQRFDDHSKEILHQVDGRAYEVHIQEKTEPIMHFCLVGVEVTRVENLPSELFVKIIPSGKYAAFTHQLKEGSFGDAFRWVYEWLDGSDYLPAQPFDIQCYDERFKGADDPESILEIYVPIKHR